MALAVVEDQSLVSRQGPTFLENASVGELLELAYKVTGILTQRLVDPAFVDGLLPVTTDESEDAAPASSNGTCGVTLEQVQSGVGRLSRVVEGAATAVAGHLARVYEDPQARHRLLGLPEGKSGYRSSAHYVEQTQQTPQRQTRQREDRAAQHLPSPGSQNGEPKLLPEVAGAFWDAAVDPSVVDIITKTLSDARRAGVKAGAQQGLLQRLIAEGESRLMGMARGESPSSVAQSCKRWRQGFDRTLASVGSVLPADQSHLGRAARFVREENGLFLWHLFLTQGQHEVFKTVASAGSNPRARANRDDADPLAEPDQGQLPAKNSSQQDLFEQFASESADGDPDRPAAPLPPERAEVRQRREVDAIIGALKAALTMGKRNGLPDVGASRPQILVTIDFESLAQQLACHPDLPPPPPIPEALRDQQPPEWLNSPVVSAGAFTGPIDPRVIRQWACDADIIPVVMGANGEVLDIGRAQRVFPPAIRKAIIARDRGCAAPGCPYPPSWCEVHHIEYWVEHQGPTSVDNGALLCAHHHHALHHDQLKIHMRNGVPWFEDTSPTARRQRAEDAQPVLARNAHWHDRGEPPW